MDFPKVSIIIVNTNELHHLRECLPSLFEQTYPNFNVYIVDNCSSDGSHLFVQQQFPNINWVQNAKNLGYAGGNNLGMQIADGDYYAILNPDTRVQNDWLWHLVNALENDTEAGFATPKILLWDDNDKINTCGNDVTFTGITFCRGLDKPKDDITERLYVSAVSGAAFLVRRSLIEEIGGFDDDYFLYFEDTDLCLRAALAGYKAIFVPDSIIYHKYQFKFHPNKAFYQERNRHYTLLKIFHWPTYFVLAPSLLFGELLAWGFALLRGREHVRSLIQALYWLIKHHKKIRLARKRAQSIRKVKDRDILQCFQYKLNFTRTTNPRVEKFLTLFTTPFNYLISRFVLILVWW